MEKHGRRRGGQTVKECIGEKKKRKRRGENGGKLKKMKSNE